MTHAAELLGAPAPTRPVSVRVRGYAAGLGLADGDDAQLRRAAVDAFGRDHPVTVHRCTQPVRSTLDRPVFDPELEGVPEGWTETRLGGTDTRQPDRLWQLTTRPPRKREFRTLHPGDKMVLVSRAGAAPIDGSGSHVVAPAEGAVEAGTGNHVMGLAGGQDGDEAEDEDESIL